MKNWSETCLSMNVFQIRKKLFEKPLGFNLPVSEDVKLFESLVIFDFEPI